MARMHSRKKGVSKSKKPASKKVPEWVSMDKEELQLLIEKFAKKNESTAKIGMILRDSYGVPDVKGILGMSISKYLATKGYNSDFPEDLKNLMKRVLQLRKHYELNKQDRAAKRGIQLGDSKINRLVKYYKEKGVLESTFRYVPSELNIYLK
ncbi:MAG: 30S ribosomal protein S15 [Nanobdellota archaeon]